MKNIVFFSMCLITVLICLSKLTLAQQQPRQESQAAFESFQMQYPDSIVEWDRRTGNPRTLTNFSSEKLTGDLTKKSKKFLEARLGLLGLAESSQIQAQSSKPLPNDRYLLHHRFTQNISGVPVVGSEIVVHQTREGEIFRIDNAIFSKTNIVGRPFPSRLNAKARAEAIKIAQQQLSRENKLIPLNSKYPREPTATPAYWPIDDGLLPVWNVRLKGHMMMVDLANNKVLAMVDLSRHVAGGRVYLEGKCANPVSVVIGLEDLNDSGFLSGSNFDVWGEKQWFDERQGKQGYSRLAASAGNTQFPEGLFDFPASRVKRQAQVSAYHHFTNAREYFRSLGFTDIPPGGQGPSPDPLFVVVNGRAYACDAEYIPGENWFYFGIEAGDDPLLIGDSGACGNSALDPQKVYHEYGHYVLQTLWNPNPFQSQALAIDAGLANYFSASAFDKPCLYQDLTICSGCITDASTPIHYDMVINPSGFPTNQNSIQRFGFLVISSALWELRSRAGQVYADSLALDTARALPSNATVLVFAETFMIEALAKIERADSFLVKILMMAPAMEAQKIFCDRGFPMAACL